MKAMICEAFGCTPEVRDAPDPAPEPDGAGTGVSASALCRSDWHGWMGHDADVRLPIVPGHEFSGVVAVVGRRVERFRPGDRVTVPFVHACARCGECRADHQQVCGVQTQPGFTH